MRPPHTAKRGSLTVSDIGERALIARIRARVGTPPSWIALGIGDDAAIVEPVRGRHDVLTTDSLVEDVHFKRAWTSPHDIGRKSVVVNLSDLAAMGATPRALLLSLCLPPGFALDDFDALIDGVVAEADGAGAPLVGGNLARSPGPLVVNVTAVGAVHPRRVLRRGAGRPGDELYLTGSIGGAAAGLEMLEAGVTRSALDPIQAACLERYERPEARVRCGRLVAGHRAASAAMDLSDGLADAVRQMAEAGGTGATINAEALPVEPGARAWWEARRASAVVLAIAGGEDYELLFAVPPKRRRAFQSVLAKCPGLTATRIGEITRGSDLVLVRGEHRDSLPFGFVHFKS